MNQLPLFWVASETTTGRFLFPMACFPVDAQALVAAGADVWSIRVSEGEMKRIAGEMKMNPDPLLFLP